MPSRLGPVVIGAAALLAGTACAPDPPNAIVKVEVLGCQPGTEVGSGTMVADDIVLTAAHTLRGAREITVSRGEQAVSATVVAFDPDNDLAYLRADLDPHDPIPVDAGEIVSGSRGSAWVVRGDETVRLDVTVVRPIRINTEDIYIDALVTRPGIELEAAIRPGDSGGPVIVDGSVIGVLWARSRRNELRAYAIDPDRGGEVIERQLSTGELDGVDVTRCA